MRRRTYGSTWVVIGAAMLLTAGYAFAQAASQRDVTDVLPSGTTAYLRLSNLPGLYKAMDQSGLKATIVKGVLMDKPQLALDVAACDRLLSRLQTLHVSFHGVRTVDDELADLDVLVVAEGALGSDPRAWVPPLLKPFMREAGSFANVPVYEFASNDEDDEQPPVELLLAGVEGKILFATDRLLLEDTLEAMATGRGLPLSKNQDFLRMSRGQTKSDVFLYVSAPGVLRSIHRSMDRYDRDDFQTAVKVLDIEDILCGSCSLDYGASAACVRVMLNPDGKLYKLISLPAAPQTMPANLPQDAFMYFGVNIQDGAAFWRRALDHVCEKLIAMEEVQDKEEFYGPIRAAEQKLNVSFEDMAACVSGQFGVFFCVPDFEEGGGVFAFVKDPAKASQIMEAITAKQFPDKHVVEDIQGVTVRVAGTEYNGLTWAMMDNCLLCGPRPDPIKKCITARKTRAALSDSATFKALAPRLHPEALISAYINLGTLMGTSEARRDVPEAFAEWAQGVIVAATAVVKDGEVEARFAQSRGGDVTEYCILLRTIIEQQLEEQRRAREGRGQ